MRYKSTLIYYTTFIDESKSQFDNSLMTSEERKDLEAKNAEKNVQIKMVKDAIIEVLAENEG